MSLIYNGTTIPEHGGLIEYNGTYLDRVIYNSTTVWRRAFTLTITTDAHVSASVTRTSSPLGGSLTALSSGSDIYHGDVLAVSASVTTTGYAINWNSSYPTSASNITVSYEDVSVRICEYVLSYTLFLSGGTGVASASVTRTSSPLKGASTGVIRTLTTSGLTAIYYGDTLTVSATASSGYVIDSSSFEYSYTVTDNIVISITAKKQLTAPYVTLYRDEDSSTPHSVIINITNTNSVAVTASYHYTITYMSGLTETHYGNVSINGNTGVQAAVLATSSTDAVSCSCYLTASGYATSATVTSSIEPE